MLRQSLIAILTGTAAMVAVASEIRAEPVCGPRAMFIDGLKQSYGEKPIGRGLAEGAMVEVLTGPSGSWTIIATDPRGMACVIGSGEAWTSPDQPRPAKLVEKPA
ncbi:MAG: hypothetical protein FJX46_11340 [Alphaproteobacteria bacterium]|nr:hypothetical protein [Alphaproteobacteria bacterium]